MGKLSLEQAGSTITVVNKLSHPEAVNERELNALAVGMVDGLLPVATEKKKKDVFLKAQAEGLISLHTYFSGIVSKKMFCDTVLGIVQLVKECEQNHLNPGNLCLDAQYLFLDPRTKKVGCIFWPLVNNQSAQHPAAFFGDLPFRVVFNKHEDTTYVSKYLEFFRAPTPFAINAFERLLFSLAGRSMESERLPSGHIPYGGEKQGSAPVEASTGATGSIAYDPLRHGAQQKQPPSVHSTGPAPCAACGTHNAEAARFCANCGTALESKAAYQPEGKSNTTNGTTVLGYSNGTTVLGVYEESSTVEYPYLLRVHSGDKIPVDKPVFRIGTERPYSDFFISDNSAISRSHADIITREGRYFIIDRNSTNKTRVDERVLTPEQEFEIYPGTRLRLADEDFVFDI